MTIPDNQCSFLVLLDYVGCIFLAFICYISMLLLCIRLLYKRKEFPEEQRTSKSFEVLINGSLHQTPTRQICKPRIDSFSIDCTVTFHSFVRSFVHIST